MKEITTERVNELAANEEFLQQIRAVSSPDEALSVFRKFGIELTEEELKDGYDRAKGIFEQKGYLKDGELTEDYLEAVAGGFWGQAGVVAGAAGLLLMMSGGGAIAVGLWAGGCLVGLAGGLSGR